MSIGAGFATSVGFGALTVSSVDTPGVNPLQIGSVVFTSPECPSALPIGALEQKLAVTELLGGGRDVQSMGVQPKTVAWRGVLWQPNITQRKNALRAMMVSRAEYPLKWMDEQYFCKIKEFTPTASHANRCEYEITVEITRATNGALTSANAATLDTQISGLVGSAQAQAKNIAAQDPTGAQKFQQALNAAISAIATAAPIAQMLAPQVASVLATLSTAVAAVDAYAGSLAEGDPNYVAAQQLGNYLSLMVTNVQRGQATQTVRIQGISLFELASQFYGDPSLGFALAAANGLPSPNTSLQVPTDISLPPYPKVS